MAALLVWRHRDNIARLLAGTESRLGAEEALSPVRSQRGFTVKLMLSSGVPRRSSASAAANAIIAPLSVHSSGSG